MSPEAILVVDDTDDLRTLTAEILRLAGFQVMEARNGAEALAQASGQPDLIVLDVHMPGMDGFEVCRRLKGAPATAAIPVLYLSSAHREQRDRVRGLESGGAGYLVRPLEPSELVTSVRALLRLRHADRVPAGVERYQQLFDRASDGVWAADESGALTYVNERFAAMLGYAADEMLGRTFADFVDREDRPTVGESLGRHGGGISRLDECRCWRKDGTEMWAVVSAIPLADAAGAPRGTIAVVMDVTHRKRAEAAEREAATLRSVASLATAAAHEINNPLTVILGALEMLERRGGVDDTMRQRFDRARAAACEIQAIVRRMTRISRLPEVAQSPALPPMLDLLAATDDPIQTR